MSNLSLFPFFITPPSPLNLRGVAEPKALRWAGLGIVQMSNAVRRRKYWANTIKNDLFDEEYCMNAIFRKPVHEPANRKGSEEEARLITKMNKAVQTHCKKCSPNENFDAFEVKTKTRDDPSFLPV